VHEPVRSVKAHLNKSETGYAAAQILQLATLVDMAVALEDEFTILLYDMGARPLRRCTVLATRDLLRLEVFLQAP
jgi:hypothetical protein